MKGNRRRHRSDLPVEAVRLQLRACEEEYDVVAFVLADARGMVLATPGSNLELCEILAAYAPLLDETPSEDSKAEIATTILTHSPESRGKPLKVRRFEVQEESMFLCGLVGRDTRVEEAFDRAVNGVRRIIGESP